MNMGQGIKLVVIPSTILTRDPNLCSLYQVPGTPPLTILAFEKGFHGRTLGKILLSISYQHSVTT